MAIHLRHGVIEYQSSVAMQNLREEFLNGYVALAEGEKDPRNLLLAFAIARVLLIEFDVSHHIEVSTHHLPRSYRLTF